jgi:hypoxanthine-DNA glycosylase
VLNALDEAKTGADCVYGHFGNDIADTAFYLRESAENSPETAKNIIAFFEQIMTEVVLLIISNQVTHPFAPIGDARSRVLILGTMPSVQSRKAAFYYSHPRNRFWLVLAKCFDQPPPENIAEKTRLLLENGIALWDVLCSCEITGSGDASIRKPVCNNIAAFVSGKSIQEILCNGQKAYSLYRQNYPLSLPVFCMPSTSPANAAWNTEHLIAVWKKALRPDIF